MAKLLNMKLNYKGKLLDFVREGRDIKKKFFIGSNKYLFWQILDPKFPDKHLFITEKGNQYYMQLPPGAKLSCAKNGEPVDSTYLTKNNILQGTELQLRPDMTGTVAIAPEWEISYEYKEPWVTVLTPEEKQIVAQYARFSEPTAMERFNRNIMLLFVFLTVVFLLVFQAFLKPKESFDTTVEEKLATLQKAELVKYEESKIEGSALAEKTTSGTADKPAPEVAAEAGTPSPNAGAATSGGSAISAGSMFGIGAFDPTATSSAAPTIRVATLTEGFSSSRPGGGGGGSGPGAGGGGPNTGGGRTSSFDPNAQVGFSSDLGKIATNAPSVGGSSIRPKEGSFVNVAGDLRKLAPSGVAFGLTSGTNKLVSSFKSQNVAQVTESSIQAAAPETRTRYETIGATVKARQSQIAAIYSKYNAILPFTGSASIRLLISANGRVQSAIITPNGNLPEEFLKEVKNLCEGWTFSVNDNSDYTFTTRFRKS
ncbi:MAG: hypothetical protein PHY48_01095 [Candidatus Cloacimonetes bacterium]|nr:hypothetical protein [Candidatus Cloacimonadota bacterium]